MFTHLGIVIIMASMAMTCYNIGLPNALKGFGFFIQVRNTVQQEILAGENLGEFGDLPRIRQSFICQLLVISEKARGWA